MSIAAEKVAEVLALPGQDRAYRARQLIASLDDTIDADAETQWNEVIDRRSREMAEGRVDARPEEEMIRDIQANIRLEKSLCGGAPFYVLGPLPTDIAPGYDHITAAIGGAIAGWAGADYLCYVTPSEHLRLPTLDDVREGVIASKIAAHIADIAKGIPGAVERDHRMARARKELDWEGQIAASLDPVRSRAWLEKSASAAEEGCTMCGDLCAVKMGRQKKAKTG